MFESEWDGWVPREWRIPYGFLIAVVVATAAMVNIIVIAAYCDEGRKKLKDFFFSK